MNAYSRLLERKRKEVKKMLSENNSTYTLNKPYPQVRFVVESENKKGTNSLVTLNVSELTLVNDKIMVSGSTELGDNYSLPIESAFNSYEDGELIIYEHIGFADNVLPMVQHTFDFIKTTLDNQFLMLFRLYGNVISDTDNDLDPCYIKASFDDFVGIIWYEFTEIKFEEGKMLAYDCASETYIDFDTLTFEDKVKLYRHFYILTEGSEKKNLYIGA